MQRGGNVFQNWIMILSVIFLMLSSHNGYAENSEESNIPDDYAAAEEEIRSWEQHRREPATAREIRSTSGMAFTPRGAANAAEAGAASSNSNIGSSANSSSAGNMPRKATLNFEDELVEGGTQKPELFYLFQKKNFNYKRLIKLRENFIPEMRKTAEDVQRVRGPN